MLVECCHLASVVLAADVGLTLCIAKVVKAFLIVGLSKAWAQAIQKCHCIVWVLEILVPRHRHVPVFNINEVEEELSCIVEIVRAIVEFALDFKRLTVRTSLNKLSEPLEKV